MTIQIVAVLLLAINTFLLYQANKALHRIEVAEFARGVAQNNYYQMTEKQMKDKLSNMPPVEAKYYTDEELYEIENSEQEYLL